MKDIYILAIETSCDETSISIVKNGTEDISSIVLSQMDIHATFGGVVPEIASRHHIENITMVLDQVFKDTNLTLKDMSAIGIAYGPGLIGSLLIGLQTAKTLSYLFNIPLIPVHHLAGHIYGNNLDHELEFPLIALVVSGGHTELIYMEEHYQFKKLGGTLDDAVGEAYDKVARVMNLPYPGGPEIDKLAKTGHHNYELPTPLDDKTYNFSFSGIKSAVLNLINKERMLGNGINKADLATSFQETVVNILVKKTIKAAADLNVNNIILAGGVAANRGLRETLTEVCKENNLNLMIPPFKYCTDNATMIGAAAYYAFKLNIQADLEINSISQLRVDKSFE